MSIWTRISEALSALATGEGLSAVFDKLQAPPERSVAFTIAVIALGAKMAKADGQVTRDEVSAFRQVFHIPPREEANAARVFNLARADVAGRIGWPAKPCATAADCSMNGECAPSPRAAVAVDRLCRCNRGWTGDRCQTLELGPATRGAGIWAVDEGQSPLFLRALRIAMLCFCFRVPSARNAPNSASGHTTILMTHFVETKWSGC